MAQEKSNRNPNELKFQQELDRLADCYAKGWKIYAHPKTIEKFREDDEEIASKFEPNEYIEEGVLMAIDPQVDRYFKNRFRYQLN